MGALEQQVTAYVIGKHGQRNVREAIEACKEGQGTPTQQKIVVGLLEIFANAH